MRPTEHHSDDNFLPPSAKTIEKRLHDVGEQYADAIDGILFSVSAGMANGRSIRNGQWQLEYDVICSVIVVRSLRFPDDQSKIRSKIADALTDVSAHNLYFANSPRDTRITPDMII